jgi:hypothetical protein
MERVFCPNCLKFPQRIKDPKFRKKVETRLATVQENLKMEELKKKNNS